MKDSRRPTRRVQVWVGGRQEGVPPLGRRGLQSLRGHTIHSRLRHRHTIHSGLRLGMHCWRLPLLYLSATTSPLRAPSAPSPPLRALLLSPMPVPSCPKKRKKNADSLLLLARGRYYVEKQKGQVSYCSVEVELVCY